MFPDVEHQSQELTSKQKEKLIQFLHVLPFLLNGYKEADEYAQKGLPEFS